jgi:uncharacterized glyoxalase superfamily protein PhnB
MAEPRLKPFVPILFVRDVPASAVFFREKLGFTIDFPYGDPAFYGSVSRDEACLHLRFVAKPNFADLAASETSLIAASAGVSDVYRLFEQFKQRGAEITQAPTKQPWGGTDLHVRDLDGNVISFVAAQAEAG